MDLDTQLQLLRDRQNDFARRFTLNPLDLSLFNALKDLDKDIKALENQKEILAGTIYNPLFQTVKWNGASYDIFNADLTTAKANYKAKVAAMRYQKEIGGTVYNNIPVDTTDRSKTLITSANIRAMNDPNFTIKWKDADGNFVTLTATQIAALYSAVFGFVTDLFIKEAALDTEIDACNSIEALENLDLISNW